MRLTYSSGGQEIPVDYYEPSGGGRHPAVIVLHGAGGMWNPMYTQYAQQFARLGYAVFIVHYFARTGTSWADDATIEREFVPWMETVREAIDFATRQPGADPECVGIIGFSLGAFLALSIAAQDARVKAVVDFFGGMPEQLRAQCTRLPPVLILHGDADARVPVRWAHETEEVLKRCGAEYEMKIYKGAGHRFDLPTMLEAGARTVSFLKKHLKLPN